MPVLPEFNPTIYTKPSEASEASEAWSKTSSKNLAGRLARRFNLVEHLTGGELIHSSPSLFEKVMK